MSLSTRRATRKIEKMTQDEKEAYLSTAKRVTVGHYETVTGRSIKKVYYAKIRGCIVGNSNEWTHETPEAAMKYGQEVLAEWRAQFRRKPQPSTCPACNGTGRPPNHVYPLNTCPVCEGTGELPISV